MIQKGSCGISENKRHRNIDILGKYIRLTRKYQQKLRQFSLPNLYLNLNLKLYTIRSSAMF